MKKYNFIEGIKVGQRAFADTIATIINSILLSFVYLIGIGLTSITAKIFKKKFLDLNKKNSKTYWQDFNLTKKPLETYYRQF
jgi:hypothetical protein